ncbi:hypothetical protein H6K97_11765 [Staphylococcus epidermidis]|nr:hypothetical protein [Staphylococcus epidermidis]MBM6209955.1 hypothetical protein [Staphylococcus epidermidis]MBM6212275.1 hypothetical protein [Staphylococcus epidermidis]MBM6219262.1 hypothetical protein [Staphylococcus epidermidis]MBM6223784.1 hypothetical protein [Staphylococcus epidermidis]
MNKLKTIKEIAQVIKILNENYRDVQIRNNVQLNKRERNTLIKLSVFYITSSFALNILDKLTSKAKKYQKLYR